MINIISINNKLIRQKIIERSHSLSGFSKYVRNIMLEKYEYGCTAWSFMSVIFMNVLK